MLGLPPLQLVYVMFVVAQPNQWQSWISLGGRYLIAMVI